MIWFLALQLAVGPAQHYENAKQDFARRKFSEAVSEVDTALHESPYMVPALILKARLAQIAHRPDVAKSCLITAITADPTSEEAQFFLGVVFYMENDFKLAISPLRTAQTLAPNGPLPVFYLAMTQEARRFVSGLVWGSRDFTELFTAADGYPNGDLARIYGVEPPANRFWFTRLVGSL